MCSPESTAGQTMTFLTKWHVKTHNDVIRLWKVIVLVLLHKTYGLKDKCPKIQKTLCDIRPENTEGLKNYQPHKKS